MLEEVEHAAHLVLDGDRAGAELVGLPELRERSPQRGFRRHSAAERPVQGRQRGRLAKVVPENCQRASTERGPEERPSIPQPA